MAQFTEGFIASTAKDYDTDISIVENIALLSDDGLDFYERMEDYVKTRAAL